MSKIYETSFEEVWKKLFGKDALLCIFCDYEARTLPTRQEPNEELKNHVNKHHHRYAVLSNCQGNSVCMLRCQKNCLHRKSNAEKSTGHFHCSFCGLIYGRSQSFKKHMEKNSDLCNHEGSTSTSNFKTTNNVARVKDNVSKCKEDTYKCVKCSCEFKSREALRRQGGRYMELCTHYCRAYMFV